jgi:hypothetical protein
MTSGWNYASLTTQVIAAGSVTCGSIDCDAGG